MSPDRPTHNRDPMEKQLDVGTWGAFFLWLGISLLAPLSWGVWLLGVGLIILGAQLARRMVALRVEVFWLVAGALFVLGGISEIGPFGFGIAIIPVLCIAAGVGLLAKAVIRRAGPRHG